MSELLVTVNANGTATGTVCDSWANANGDAAPGRPATVGRFRRSLPPFPARATSAIAAPATPTIVILGEVQYPFQPTGIYFTVASITLSDSIMMIPRTAAEITVQ